VSNFATGVVDHIKEDPLQFVGEVAAGVAAAALVGAVCATGVGCVILAGAVAGAVSAGYGYSLDVAQGEHAWDWGDFGKDVVEGAVVGGITAGVLHGGGKLLRAGLNRVRAGGARAVDGAPTEGAPTEAAKPAGGGAEPTSAPTPAKAPAAPAKAPTNPSKLYHYTNEAGYKGITNSRQLNPSLEGGGDAHFGSGQYLTDIAPERVLPGSKASIGPEKLAQGFMSRWMLSARLFSTPWKAPQLTHFLEIDVSGLNVLNPRPGTYLVPGETPLDLTGRITRGGQF
jgi:hypothetical protein